MVSRTKDLEQLGEKSLQALVDHQNLPEHVAIIMDGNGRWAAERYLPRIAGHRRGIQSVREIVTFSREIGIKVLTLFAFSNENWNRPSTEISQLMMLLERYLKQELKTMTENQIRFRAVGQIERLPGSVLRMIRSVEEKTAKHEKMTLILALSYGGRSEIVDAVRRVVEDVQQEKLSMKDLDEQTFSHYLHTQEVPDPDLMIRTSGEVRISNFLLWQLAYTELYFTQTYWPDFRRKDFLLALLDYQARERRFGLVKEQVANPNGAGKGGAPGFSGKSLSGEPTAGEERDF
ncbi:MAG: isoprenyl transferase [Nitrospirae bacterium]|nr:isoprenyl transferase [Candidatus Manganitrophaceae bacterium]